MLRQLRIDEEAHRHLLLFVDGDRHISAEELHEEALSIGFSVSLATVYNTLHQFTQAGMLRILPIEGARTYFDTNVSEHHHFFLEEEGELVDTYLKLDNEGDYVLKQTPCAFLAEDNTCNIYEDRPSDCRRYPYTDEDVLIKRVPLTLKNATVCPITFHVLERLQDVARQAGGRAGHIRLASTAGA